MADQPDWSPATWEGNRLAQHREFQALPFREKLRIVEGLGEVTEFFLERARIRAAKWYRKSADQGDAESQVAIAMMYLDGCCLEADQAVMAGIA